MRVNRRIQQKMHYSVFVPGGEPRYVYDEDGNQLYDVMPDGKKIPRTDGSTVDHYAEPVEFYNSISGSLSEYEREAFGVAEDGMCKMTYLKGEYPFTAGTVIWKDSPIQRKDDGTPDDKSADYYVTGILKEGRHYHRAMLRYVTKGEGV